MFVPDAIANNTTPIASVCTLLAVIVQAAFAHMKGRKGKRIETDRAKSEEKRAATLSEIHNTLTEFAAAQRETNEMVSRRQTGLYYIVTGADDERGANGLRSSVADHEKRIRAIEGDRPRVVVNS